MASLTRNASDDIQRRALHAAAKVALTMSAASVFGACGGSMSSETPHTAQDDAGTDSNAADVGTVSVDSTATTKPVPDAVVESTSCGPIAPDAATPTQTECCAAKVRATFSPTWTESASGGAGEPHPELVECCDVIVDQYNGVHEWGLTFQQARACCYVLPPPWYSHGGAACTPWGPPMPPAMPSSLAEDDDGLEALS